MYSISVCQTRTDRSLFEKIPELLHGTDPSFTPPFPSSVAKFLEAKSPYQRQHGKIQGFIARRNGVPCGRIAAITNRSHNAYHQDTTGFFGFFAAKNDPALARALFAGAEAWLREQGCGRIRGPYNPSINDDCGLLTEGFEGIPFVAMPWNPSYYESLLDAAEFKPIREMAAYMLDLSRGVPERIRKITARMRERSGWTIRGLRMNRLKEELATLYRLYNCTLDRNWGFVPVTLEDFLASADDFRAIVDPEMILFAEKNGQAGAFAVAFPNFNEILLQAKFTPPALRRLHIAWLMKTHRYHAQRLAVLGIAPGVRDQGLSAVLFAEQYERSARRYQVSEVSWVEANNHEIQRGAEMMHGRKYRTYKIFERPLA
ncbi:MAG TPA: hypothetical protein VIS74_02235 [Chthoniobacterales bacterium]